MSISVCLRPTNTLNYLHGGGHISFFLNWAGALRSVGCDVIWLEEVPSEMSPSEVQANVDILRGYLEPEALVANISLFARDNRILPREMLGDCLSLEDAAASDLLLNMRYDLPQEVVSRFRRSALVDIDPGLLQLWVSKGQINLARHDLYFSIGETVGQPGALFPDCGVRWHYTPPPVYLPVWTPVKADSNAPYTTISHWWEYWIEFQGELFDNSKRGAFLAYLDLPSRVPVQLELAVPLESWDEEDLQLLTRNGWNVRNPLTEIRTPEQYRLYVRQSRGEFSCAKPSCFRLQNAWISERTLCYLASGKPAVVQYTGVSRFLPDAEGLLRFRSPEEAASLLDLVESDYERHCRAARDLAEEYFDAQKVATQMLELALS